MLGKPELSVGAPTPCRFQSRSFFSPRWDTLPGLGYPTAPGIEISILLETTKGCSLNAVRTWFFFSRNFLHSRTIVRLFIFVGLVPVARIFLTVQLSSEFLITISKAPMVEVVELQGYFAEF